MKSVDPNATLEAVLLRVQDLEEALADYVQRYGMTDRARKAMALASSLDQWHDSPPPAAD